MRMRGSLPEGIQNDQAPIGNQSEKGTRGGSGNSTSVLSGSLASSASLRGGYPKVRGNAANTTKSRSNLQSIGRPGRYQKREDAG